MSSRNQNDETKSQATAEQRFIEHLLKEVQELKESKKQEVLELKTKHQEELENSKRFEAEAKRLETKFYLSEKNAGFWEQKFGEENKKNRILKEKLCYFIGKLQNNEKKAEKEIEEFLMEIALAE